MAIVKDDAVVFTKGYGVRTLGDPTPVTAPTVFWIGSATKAFTVASLAMLVDAGKLRWDDPATKYLPGLQLYDPYVTRELTVRDLLTHRSGLEGADFLWDGSGYDRDEILRHLRYLEPSWSFRSRFGYQNIMYLAAGQIIPAVTGQSWDTFVQERIFTPLGMTASHTSVTALPSGGDVAAPHAWIEGKVQPLPWHNLDNIGPAGSITSNVLDMAQWVRLQLGEGTYQQVQLFSAAVAKEMHMPQTVIRPEPPWSWFFPEAHFVLYGLGWFLHDYQGRKVVEHGGGTSGIRALVTLLPEEKLGLVILTNLGEIFLPEALRYRVFDAYLGRPPRDWSWEFLQEAKGRLEQTEAERKKQEATRVELIERFNTAPLMRRPLGRVAEETRAMIFVIVSIYVFSFAALVLGALVHLQVTRSTPRTKQRIVEVFLLHFLCGGWGVGSVLLMLAHILYPEEFAALLGVESGGGFQVVMGFAGLGLA
ncbi:MAG TPA: serine hydrolase domain-containing protein, partial [Candidatus Binatia bacterium]|nr:serine hydrolase domain-containing protein [Candidatus Binatia bacterium]